MGSFQNSIAFGKNHQLYGGRFYLTDGSVPSRPFKTPDGAARPSLVGLVDSHSGIYSSFLSTDMVGGI